MDKREKNINVITERLTYLQLKVKNRNSLNLTDINVHAENFYRDFFNLLGFSFENTNYDEQNAAHIDLIDSANQRAIQVTSQNDNDKISSSIKGFFEKSEYKEYKLEVLLISKDAKDYRTDFTDGGRYNFDHKNDVKDVKKLIAEINNETAEKIEAIASFLDKEILAERAKTESTEVETIMALIDFLSRDENRTLIERDENVDPDKKIYKRFSEHSGFIIGQYQDLLSIYNVALVEARKGIDTVEALIISSYLKDESDQLLTKHNNDPKFALNELVNYFYNKLSENGFIKFDKQAIRYYLLDEMIKCNVFPNQ